MLWNLLALDYCMLYPTFRLSNVGLFCILMPDREGYRPLGCSLTIGILIWFRSYLCYPLVYFSLNIRNLAVLVFLWREAAPKEHLKSKIWLGGSWWIDSDLLYTNHLDIDEFLTKTNECIQYHQLWTLFFILLIKFSLVDLESPRYKASSSK